MCNSNLSEGSEMNLAGESHYIVLMDNKLAQDTGNLTQYSKPGTGPANSWGTIQHQEFHLLISPWNQDKPNKQN